MKLISTTDFIIEREILRLSDVKGNKDLSFDKEWQDGYYEDMLSYAAFMKRPLEESMFVVPPGKFDPTKTILFKGFSPEKYPKGNNLLVSVDDNLLMIKTSDPSGWQISYNLKVETNNIERLFLQLAEWNVSLNLSDNAIAQIFKLTPYDK